MAVRGFIEDENGAIIVKMGDRIVYSVPDGQEESFTFPYTLYSVGNHTFRLFFDPDDGRPNGEGDEHWKEMKVEVKPMKGTEPRQVGFECDDVRFDFKDMAYRATLSCRVYLYNPAEKEVAIRDVTVINNHYSLGDLEDVPLGSLNLGKWSVDPESFNLPPHGVETVSFKLPLEISSWVPISVADATEVVFKDGEYVTVNFKYSLGYSYDGSEWKHFDSEVQTTAKVTMDAKTVAADYLLSGGMAVLDPDTMISYNIGTVTVFGKSINVRVSIDAWPIIWNTLIKPSILELLERI